MDAMTTAVIEKIGAEEIKRYILANLSRPTPSIVWGMRLKYNLQPGEAESVFRSWSMYEF